MTPVNYLMHVYHSGVDIARLYDKLKARFERNSVIDLEEACITVDEESTWRKACAAVEPKYGKIKKSRVIGFLLLWLRNYNQQCDFLHNLCLSVLSSLSDACQVVLSKLGMVPHPLTTMRQLDTLIDDWDTFIQVWSRQRSTRPIRLFVDDFQRLRFEVAYKGLASFSVTNAIVSVGGANTTAKAYYGTVVDYLEEMVSLPAMLEAARKVTVFEHKPDQVLVLLTSHLDADEPIAEFLPKLPGASTLNGAALLGSFDCNLKSNKDILATLLMLFQMPVMPFLFNGRNVLLIGDYPVFVGLIRVLRYIISSSVYSASIVNRALFSTVWLEEWHALKSLDDGVIQAYYYVIWLPFFEMLLPNATRSFLPSEKSVARKKFLIKALFFGWLEVRAQYVALLTQRAMRVGGDVEASFLLHLLEVVLPLLVLYQRVSRAGQSALLFDYVWPQLMLLCMQVGKLRYAGAFAYVVSQLKVFKKFNFLDTFATMVPDNDGGAIIEGGLHSKLSAEISRTQLASVGDLQRAAYRVGATLSQRENVAKVLGLSGDGPYRREYASMGFGGEQGAWAIEIGGEFAKGLCEEVLLVQDDRSFWTRIVASEHGSFAYESRFGFLFPSALPLTFARPGVRTGCDRVGLSNHNPLHEVSAPRLKLRCGHEVAVECVRRKLPVGNRRQGARLLNHCGAARCAVLWPDDAAVAEEDEEENVENGGDDMDVVDAGGGSAGNATSSAVKTAEDIARERQIAKAEAGLGRKAFVACAAGTGCKLGRLHLALPLIRPAFLPPIGEDCTKDTPVQTCPVHIFHRGCISEVNDGEAGVVMQNPMPNKMPSCSACERALVEGISKLHEAAGKAFRPYDPKEEEVKKQRKQRDLDTAGEELEQATSTATSAAMKERYRVVRAKAGERNATHRSTEKGASLLKASLPSPKLI